MPRLKTNYEIISDKSKNPVVSSEYVKHNNEWLNDKLDYIETHTPTLDEDGKIPSSQLPSYVDDVLEFKSKSYFPSKGESGKIYVDIATRLTYRWSGTTYVEISPSIAIGTTAETAFAGDKGQEAYVHAYSLGNPHRTTYNDLTGQPVVTPEMFGAVGDGEADDTAAVQTAFDKGGNVLINGTYRCTKTVNITKSNTIIAGIGTIIGDFNTDGSVIACSASNDNRKDHIRVKDIEIRSSSTGAHNGIIFNHEITSGIGFTDVVIDGVTVNAVTGNGIHLHGGTPTSNTIRPFISIINCKIFNVKKVGICESRVSSRIQKCLIRGSGLENITVDNGCYLTVISDNILQTSNGGVGNIGVDQCDRCIIANNQIVSYDYGTGHDSDYNCGVRAQCNTGNVTNLIIEGNIFTGGKYSIYLGNTSKGFMATGIISSNSFLVVGISDVKFDKIGRIVIEGNYHHKIINDEFKANIQNALFDRPVIIPLSECVQEGFELVGSDETDNRVVVTSEKISITARFNRANKASGDVPFVLPFTVSKGADFLEQEGNEVCLRTNGNVQMYGDYKNMGDDDTVQFSVTLPRFA